MIVTKISKALAVVAAAAVVGMPALVDAQAQATNQPVAYGADSVEYAPNRIILRGRAEATQGGNRFRADTLTLVSGEGGDLQRAEASGTVYFVTPDQSMRGAAGSRVQGVFYPNSN